MTYCLQITRVLRAPQAMWQYVIYLGCSIATDPANVSISREDRAVHRWTSRVSVLSAIYLQSNDTFPLLWRSRIATRLRHIAYIPVVRSHNAYCQLRDDRGSHLGFLRNLLTA